MIWFVSDHHFGDKRLDIMCRKSWASDTNKMNRIMVNRWNSLIQTGDTVYYLGDFSVDEQSFSFANLLNGKIIFIRGNKEDVFSDDFLLQYFDEVHQNYVLENIFDQPVFLTHKPEDGRKDMFNLVGHIHAAWRVQRNMINVSFDAWLTSPATVDDIKFQMSFIKSFADQNVFAGELPPNVK